VGSGVSLNIWRILQDAGVMQLRVIIGSISHETNTFSNVSTTLPDFIENLHRGQDILEVYTGQKAIASAFIKVLSHIDITLIPAIWTHATPSGLIKDDTFKYLLAQLLEPLNTQERVDGILLHLHGAMVTESLDDPEGKILSTLRNHVGDNVPIISTLDFHANITEQMVQNADVLVGYDTYPHVDGYDRGIEAATLMVQLLNDQLKPISAFARPPLLVSPQRQKTEYYPMKDVMMLAHKMEKEEEVIAVTVAGGYPFADLEFTGMSFIVTTNNDPISARDKADQLAKYAWNLRRQFLAEVVSPTLAVAEAAISPQGPIVLADHADNPGGGAPCDGTVLLKALIDHGAQNAVLAVIADPEAVQQLIQAGVGSTLTINLGGKTDRLHGSTLKVNGHVKLISDGTFRATGPMATGLESQMGRTVVFTSNDIDIIVTEKRLQPTDLELYRSVGIEPAQKKIIAVKSAVHFRASHEPIAFKIIEVDTPGIHSARLSAFRYQKLRRPIFPLDAELLDIAELKSQFIDETQMPDSFLVN
jgi:microcystin degradation protein MlrC